ncbi:MAG: peptidoglycan-binding protein [Actinomycetota bacterium]|nr:peptidoglycan-binding protein [Actinomycetota bacterium]
MRLYHSGDRGEPVRDIQRRLTALGMHTKVDGFYGSVTVAAVRSFQDTRGLPSDGIVGPETWRTLVDAGFRLGDRMLYRRSPMMRGDDVSRLQQSLGSLGFDAGKVDGFFGPDTLRAVLDFQHNRGMAEDGFAGRAVTEELLLMASATDKPGREVVREHEWVDSLPQPIAGARIYVDPNRGEPSTPDSTWSAATRLASDLQLSGARILLSRSVDTSPSERFRARRANRLDVEIVVSITVPSDDTEGVFYFGTPLSTSEAGKALALHLASRLSVSSLPRAVPMLKETRSPAVVIAIADPSPETGSIIAQAIIDLYANGPDEDGNSIEY